MENPLLWYTVTVALGLLYNFPHNMTLELLLNNSVHFDVREK